MGFIRRKISKTGIGILADKGPLPGRYTAKGDGISDIHEILDKKYFALEVPKPTQAYIDSLPPIEEVLKLFKRPATAPKSRVSLLLPFVAQHLTDAIFQSKGLYRTDASHEIILNQVYGNTANDEKILRSGTKGKLKTQTRTIKGKQVEFPDALCTQVGGQWEIKSEYNGLSYLENNEKVQKLFEAYRGKEGDLCAVGLFQGNMTVGNFALTAILVREHNRLCDGISDELGDVSDDAVFRLARQNSIVAYMKIVIEDYINTFAGVKIFELDTKSFFYETKRWCRGSPIPYHFNSLYRIHSLIPDSLIVDGQDLGFAGFLANNDVVMKTGLGEVFEAASNQAASEISLGNTHAGLLPAEEQSLTKARGVLGSFNAHREVQKKGSSLDFNDFDPRFRDQLKKLYGNADKVDYLVGVFAELPKKGVVERLGIKSDSIMGATLLGAIGKHAFRHILGNRYMTREFLNKDAMTKFGWDNLKQTSSVSDLVKRNVPELGGRAKSLRISFDAP